MEGLTKVPATTLGVYDKVVSLESGKIANFLITNGPIFQDRSIILYNYVQGIKYNVKSDDNIAGTYALTVNTPDGTEKYTLDVKSTSSLSMFAKDTLNTRFSFDGKQVKLSYAPMQRRQRPAGAPTDSTRRHGGGQHPSSRREPPPSTPRPRPRPVASTAAFTEGLSSWHLTVATGPANAARPP